MIIKKIDRNHLPSSQVYLEMKTTVIDFKYKFIKPDYNSTDVEFVDNLEFIDKDGELLNINVGDKIPIVFLDVNDNPYETYYVANEILYRKDLHKFLAIEFKRNDVLEFLSHTVHRVIATTAYMDTYCVNCYLDKDLTYIYFKYRWFPDAAYEVVLKDLKSNKYLNKQLVETFKDVDDRFDIFKYAIPFEYKNDVQCLLKGRYESFSAKFQSSLLKFWNQPRDSYYARLFRHDPILEKIKCKEFGLTEWEPNLPLRGEPNIEYYGTNNN